MGVVSQVWYSVRSGILLILATRHAAQLTSGGSFVGCFVGLLAIVLLVYALEYEFLLATPKRLSEFDSLREVSMSLAQLIITYLSYVLAAQVIEWFTDNFMVGPFLWELLLVVAIIIAVFAVASVRFGRYLSARASDVDHLGKISDQEVQRYRRRKPTRA